MNLRLRVVGVRIGAAGSVEGGDRGEEGLLERCLCEVRSIGRIGGLRIACLGRWVLAFGQKFFYNGWVFWVEVHF